MGLAALKMMALVMAATGAISMEERPVMRRDPVKRAKAAAAEDLPVDEKVWRAVEKRRRKAAINRCRLPAAEG